MDFDEFLDELFVCHASEYTMSGTNTEHVVGLMADDAMNHHVEEFRALLREEFKNRFAVLKDVVLENRR